MSLEKFVVGRCTRCGLAVSERDRFCSQCGNKLGNDRYNSSLASTRRERKIVSVMFADVKGSTEVVSSDDPERVSEWLEHIVDVMRSAVHQFGGTVNRVQGDGIMALFGAPVEFEDHSIRACAAAMEMLDNIKREATVSGPKLNIRIGIASGEVMTLPVASDPAIHYDAMGVVVHLAARLEQAATPGSALISSETRQGALKAFETRRRELTGLRGLPTIVPAFELVRWKPRRSIQISRSAQLQGLFVGREKAIGTLRDAFFHLGRKSGRSVFVSGEPGVGKSRLVSEFIAEVKADVRVCVSLSSPYGGFSYGPLADLAADLAGIDAEDSPDTRRIRLGNVVANVSPAPMDLAALNTLLDVASKPSDLDTLSPIDRRLRVEAAAIALFRSISEHQPLVLVCEDIHWLDEDRLDQIARVCEGVRTAHCLAILTARDTWKGAPTLQEKCDYRCPLSPLEPADADKMLNALVRPGRGTAALSREILERTRGNPLFIEETLNVLHQMAALVRDGHGYALKQPGVDVPLAPTVRGLLAARIDRLEGLHKDILQAIAVIGDSATLALLHSLLGFEMSTVKGAIDRLIALGLLGASTSDQPSADVSLTFRHPLIREVTYEQMLMRDRARIHQWMLARLEDEKRMGLRDRPGIMAEHAFRAEAWEKAAQYMLQAGNDAFWRDAKTEAVRYLVRGLEAVNKSDNSETSELTALKLRLELRNPLFQLARMEELSYHLNAARPLAARLSDPIHTGRYHIFQSHYHWFSGNSDGALEEANAAQSLAESKGIQALAFRAQFQRGLVHFSCGRYRDAIADMNGVTAAITRHETHNAFGLNRSLLVTTLAYSARAHADLGELAEAREYAASSLATAREINNQFEWVFAFLAEGWVNFSSNDPERALPFLEKAYETCATEDVPLMAPVAASFLSAALLMAADHRGAQKAAARDRALKLAEEAVKQGEEFRFGLFQPWRLAILSQALLAQGQRQEALDCALVARDRAHRQWEPVAEIEALIALSQAQKSLGMKWAPNLQGAVVMAQRLEISTALERCHRLESASRIASH